MDYLYGQLSESVYDPADLTGISSTGTISLDIDNDKRTINANTIRVPNALIINDRHTKRTFKYDGSTPVSIEIPQVKNELNLTYKIATLADIEAGIPTSSAREGDAYLEVIDPDGTKTFIPLERGSSSGMVCLNDTFIYASVDALPFNVPIGSIYLARNLESPSGIAVYER